MNCKYTPSLLEGGESNPTFVSMFFSLPRREPEPETSHAFNFYNFTTMTTTHTRPINNCPNCANASSTLLLAPMYLLSYAWPWRRQAEVEESLAGSLAALDQERCAHQTTKEKMEEVTKHQTGRLVGRMMHLIYSHFCWLYRPRQLRMP